ncbi:hypothetical protein F5148DRAFT_1280053 [Russula earlei]|uniref:Uncharacterized protein n=1 Tax=Russula earlei TaxID=71964 RepID=A0ACC0UKV4_9AGAM|nr:hypothetical protein F5148DRAFT_1280053 [Russula earlei]
MRVTHRVWLIVKSIYLRVTLNWITLTFFLFSFVHCFTQGTLQAFVFNADDAWGAFSTQIVAHAQFKSVVFTQFTGRHGLYSLELCDQVPVLGGDPHPCDPFFTAGQSDPITIPPRFLPSASPVTGRDDSTALASLGQSNMSNMTSALWMVNGQSPSLGIQINSEPRPDGLSNVVITSSDGSLSTTLEPVCIFSLLYPEAKLSQARREELALIGSQFWLFGLAVFGLLFESVPHILALIVARLLTTGWSTYATWRTTNISDRIQHLIADPGSPCQLDFYKPYFARRFALQMADLVLHWDALFISIYLSWRLLKMYRTNTFRHVGPPKNILRIISFAVLVSIQLSVFILMTAMALWVDQLLHGVIKKLSSHTAVYDGTFVITTVLLIPWLMMGWFSFLGAWSTMFYSRIYRFTFIDWPFFGITTMSSFASLLASTGFAFVCLRNYGKGLAEWIYLEQKFWKNDFEPDLFPNNEIEKEWKQDCRSRFDLQSCASRDSEGRPSIGDGMMLAG